MLKDVGLAVSALMGHGLPCPSGAASAQVYRMASRAGLGKHDFAAVGVFLGAADLP
jgi:3-hydroxyisobutyrate dehydrogenase-like beta-hydroxyacid dehydrogenase